MVKKIFESRRKLPIINGLLAIMMMLGTFSAAYAQGGNTQVLLPLVHVGTSVTQPVDGPFFDVPEPPAFDEDELNSLVLNEESMPEISAAAGCYSSAGRYNLYEGGSGWNNGNSGGLVVYASQNCRDLNIKVETFGKLDPGTCYVKVRAYYIKKSGQWVKGAGSHVWIGPGQAAKFSEWYSPITRISDGTEMRLYFYATPGCGRSNVHIAA